MRAFNAAAVPPPPAPEFSWNSLTTPLDLEIGAGQGLHAVQYCQNHPDRTLIALERTQNRFAILSRRQQTHQLDNLKAVRADAIAFAAHFIPPKSLERIFLLYPNPYPKKSQANLRWHRSPFLQFLHSRLMDGGTLQLATNLEWYADEAAEWLSTRALFELASRRPIATGSTGRTHFERKYLARGESCFDLIFEKRLQ
jgi:tRNA (guanine-N(7)-)-methyltransferase